MATRTNNLDGLRLVGAVAVVVGHAYHLLGRSDQVPFVLGYPISTLGVVVFFSISGYLITASWTRTRSLPAYLTARVLRIFPALVVVVLLSVLVLGPVATVVPLGDYLHYPRTWGYLDNLVLRPQYDLPGVFTTLPYPGAVNGSLWTLPAEFACYLAVPVLCLGPRRTRPLAVAVALGVSLWLAAVPIDQSPVIWGSLLQNAASMWVFFAAGSLIRLATERWGVERVLRTDVAVALVAAFAVLCGVAPTRTTDVAWVALPYAVLVAGLASTPGVRSAARFGDLSYGIYLWAFPVQQVVVAVLGSQRILLDVPLVTLLSAGLAVLSWHLVESPSMRLKDRVGRALTHRPPLRRQVAAETGAAEPVATEQTAAEQVATEQTAAEQVAGVRSDA